MATPRHALVLAAGLGTRLRPLTLARAKPAMPVAGEPLVRRILAWLASRDVTEVVLNLHHLPETIAAVVGDGSDLGVRARYSWEHPQVLGSAGGPRQALDIVGADTFFIVNGDTLTDVDLDRLAHIHRDRGAEVTLALVPNREPERYGGVRLDDAGRVVGFSRRGSGDPSFHFVGVQLVNARVFAAIPKSAPAQSIGGLYDALVATRPGAVQGWVSDAAFWDVGTCADYWTTCWAMRDRSTAGDGSLCGHGLRLDPTARVTRSIVWDDVSMGADSSLDECVVTDGVRVPAGGRYARQLLVRPWHGDGLIVAPLDGRP